MKLKNFVTFLVATSSLHSWACSNKVDPNKVILFIDTNFSDLEIKTAEKAACSRGERLAVVPKNYQAYTNLIQVYEKNQKAYEKCVRSQGNCAEIAETTRNSHLKLMDLSGNQPSIKEQIKEQLKELKENKAKIQNVTISGHDGGGSYGGYKGDFSREELGEVIKEFPEINDVQSLMLLGCYTGVQKEILSWKSIFPNVRMIGGYDGSAPLSDKLAGHTYLEDLLTKEKKLIQQSDEKKINNFMASNVRHFNMLSAAVYVNPACEEENPENEKSFYYSSKQRELKFHEFDASKCLTMKEELDKMSEVYAKYHYGEVEPPLDPSKGELRDLYDRARSIEHCVEILEADLDVNNLFNLRFYSAVKENFARYYKDDLAEVEKMLQSIKPEDLIKNLEFKIKLLEEEAQKNEEELKNFRKNLEDDLQKSIEAKNELFKKPGYKEIVDLLNLADPNTTLLGFNGTSEQNIKFEELKSAMNQIDSIKIKMHNASKIEQIMTKDAILINQQITENKFKIEELRKSESPISSIWIPTKENLAKKTRKETLDNIHNIDKAISTNLLDSKQAGALKWVAQKTADHLQYFDNPFSWHEVTSRTEAPSFQTMTLQESIQNYSNWNTGNFSPAVETMGPGGVINFGVTPIPSGGFVGGSGNGQ